MNNKYYHIILWCLIILSIVFTMFVIWSMIIPGQTVQGEDAMASNSETISTEEPDLTTAYLDHITTLPEETVAPDPEYISLIHVGMRLDTLFEMLEEHEITLIDKDWRVLFLPINDDSFLMVQYGNENPSSLVSNISEHAFRSPNEGDLDMLEPGMPIVEIIDVWGCPMECIPLSDFEKARHMYVFEDGRHIYLIYRYDKEVGLYFFDHYEIYD